MSEIKAIRLPKAATTYNVGMDHIVDELRKSGFEVENNPNTKLTPEMVTVLEKAFNKDKAIKEEVEGSKIEKIKKPSVELKQEIPIPAKKKEEEKEVLIKSNIFTVKEELKPKVEEKVAKVETVIPPVTEVTKVAEVKPVVETPKVTEPVAEEKVETGYQKLEGPKILGKVDLSKPKKTTKKAAESAPVLEFPKEEAKQVEPVKETKKVATVAEKKVEKVVEKKVEKAPEPTPVVEKAPIQMVEKEKAEAAINPDDFIQMKRVNLEGPKIMGKIELKLDKSEMPRQKVEKPKEGEKRVRARIVKPKREIVNPNNANNSPRPGGFNPGGGGGFRPGGGNGQQGGNRFGNQRPGGNFGNRPNNDQPKEITEKEIEDKIKATMAKIQAQTSKSDRSKMRRGKREAINVKMAADQENENNGKLKVTEFMTAAELASLMNIPAVKIISTCMQLGMMVSINQRLDAELIELVAGENGFEIEFQSIEDQTAFEEDEPDNAADLLTRAPIVTIMGHVDHGKTSLLDYIRNANVVAKEAGGITQHIGAYQVKTTNNREITFLDTPGHEAFTAMRARGAKVTDVAVIVIAADDAVMPQTKEAINHAQAAGVPMIFAFNKIDKDGANSDKIREQLSAMNLLVEEWGGPHQSQEISAKKGLNIDLLLEKISLQSDLLDLKANPKKRGTGTIIEATLDKGRGFTTTILVQNGFIKKGDIIVSGPYYGRIKAMFDHKGEKVDEAGPSTPVQILGLSGAPQAGEVFKVFENEQDAKDLATKRAQLIRETGIRTKKHITLDEIGRRLALGSFKELNLIIKGDVDGSVEALSDSLMKLSTDKIAVKVVHKGVGQISESDVNLATAADAIILGFNVRPSLNAKKIADSENIEVKLYSVIYNAIEDVKNAMEGLLEPTIEEKIIGGVEIREVYTITKVGTIAGSFVKEGRILRNSKLRIIRDGIVIHTGMLGSLKRFKDDVKEVTSGMECGIQIKDFSAIMAGDFVEVFEEISIAGKL